MKEGHALYSAMPDEARANLFKVQGVVGSTLVDEHHRLLLTPYVGIDYDAKACFGRLVAPPAVSTSTERVRVRSSADKCNNAVLNEAKRRVKTAQGLSEPCGGRGEQVYGHGQGKADAGVAHRHS